MEELEKEQEHNNFKNLLGWLHFHLHDQSIYDFCYMARDMNIIDDNYKLQVTKNSNDFSYLIYEFIRQQSIKGNSEIDKIKELLEDKTKVIDTNWDLLLIQSQIEGRSNRTQSKLVPINDFIKKIEEQKNQKSIFINNVMKNKSKER